MLRRLSIQIIICLCLILPFNVQGETMRFSALKTQSNTPYSNINDLYSDSYGIIWLATENGLLQYNGYEYIKCEQDTSAGVHYNDFRKIYEDSRQRLWVCTDKGLAIYDRKVKKYIHIDLQVCNTYVNGIEEDKDGHLWVLSQYGIVELDQEGKYLARYELPHNFNSLVMDGDLLWIGSHHEGLYTFHLKTKEIKRITLPHPNVQAHNPRIHTLMIASDGNLYIGTRNEGLIIYDPRTNTQHSYNRENTPTHIISNFVAKIYEDTQKRIWIGFVNGKLIVYDPQTKCFTKSQVTLPSTVDRLTINSITEDNRHNIWIGTHHYWLFFSSSTSNSFNYFKHSTKDPNSISNNAVTSFYEGDEIVMIGTDGGGLNTKEKNSNSFESIKDFGNIILDVKPGKEDEFWYATWGNSNIGVTKYNIKTNQRKTYSKGEGDNTLPTNNIHHILVEGDSVWITTDGAGICLINDVTGKVTSKLNSQSSLFSEENPQWANYIMRDSKGRLWVCTSDGVVCHQNNERHIYTLNDQKETLAQNEAKMCFCDSKGRTWLITTTGGLNIFNEEKQSFTSPFDEYHLPKTLNAITEDNQGNLWITATNEVILFNPDSNIVRHFDLDGDLDGYSFATGAIHKAKSGEIYIGSNNGFFVFNPQEITDKEQYKPNIYLKDLYVNGEKIENGQGSILDKALCYTDTIRLSYDQNHFGIEYFGIDYGQAENLTYYYRMEGLNDQWMFVGKERRAFFTNFDAGTYTFSVKACEQNGDRCATSHPLTIIIAPAWWQTWWFRAFALLFILLLFNLVMKLREKRLRQRQEVLERIVTQRTEELRTKNEKIEQQNKQLDETLNLKDRIMSIIAHDLRNPITAIVGNLSLLTNPSRQYNEEEQAQKVQQTFKSAKNLQDQMENLLEWARIQNNTILFSPSDYYLDALTKECVTLLHNLLSEKEIEVTIQNKTHTSAHIDQRMVSSIIRNLLSNAIKFTHQGGKINIYIYEKEEMVYWSIRDNGIGMDEEQVRKLLQENHLNSTFGTNNEKGSGLGLMICHEFILKNNGQWNITSQKGEGTTFTIHFPKGSLQHDKEEDVIEKETITPDKESSIAAKQYKLLIVDDNEEIRSYLNELLSDTYDMLSAGNGKSALEIATAEIPDIIISDIVMPEMDGKTLCHHLKNEPLTQHIPIILLTTEAGVDNQLDGINYGADDYITKPFNESILKAKVSTLLRNKELQREHFRKSILHMPKLEMPESQDDIFLRKINQTISDNISDSNLTVEFLAEKTALSRVQLFRKFKAITGCSPSEYIKAVRLQHAADILANGKHNIADVAYNVGFSDPKYFSNCFAEKYGMKPSQYIKEHAKNP